MSDRISITRDAGTPENVTLRWSLTGGDWVARRTMPGVNQSARLPELDTDELLEVMKHMRDFLNRTMPAEYLEPGELESNM